MHIGEQGVNCSSKFMIALGSLYHSNLLELISNCTNSTQLQIELAITLDVGKLFFFFVMATYNLA